MKKSKKVAIYTRVSTVDQNAENQKPVLLKYARNRNLKVHSIYSDIDSGSKDNRPELVKLLNAARKRMFNTVLVWRFDRFARSTAFLLNTLNEFKDLGIDFISYQENVDTSTSTGKAMFSMISKFAELERDILSERVKLGMKRARKEGKIIGRPKLKEQFVKKAQKLRKEGLPYQTIADKLGKSYGVVYKYINMKIYNHFLW